MKWLVLLALAGCDKVFLGDAKDAGVDVNPIDISNLEFANPIAIDSVNTPEEEDRPTLTEDRLELYFHRTVAGRTDIYVTKRERSDAPFGAPQVVDLMTGTNLRACISADGLRIYFSHAVSQADLGDIYFASRADRGSPWETPVRVDELSTLMTDYCGWERADRLVMFGSRDDATRRLETWTAQRAAAGQPYGSPMLLAQFNTLVGAEGAPWADANADIIVLDRRASNVSIFQATRQGTQYALRELTELGSGVGSPWLSADGRTIVYASSVNRGDIYMATR